MKLPFTDEFLISLYNFIEEVDKNSDPFLSIRTIKEASYPELFKMRREYARKKSKKNFSQFINYLKRKGYIKIKNLEEKKAVLLTEKGFDKVINSKIKLSKRKRRKDGKWQMIIFDIPEKKRFLRDALRVKLYFLGYKLLQQSVWVSPYDVSKETEKFLREHSLDHYVKLFLIEDIR